MGTIFTLSTISTSSIEEVAAAAPSAVKWFQLYVLKNRCAPPRRRGKMAEKLTVIMYVQVPGDDGC